MCRLFVMLSLENANGAKYLLEDPCSIFAQSKVNLERLQGDGWGIGFYANGAVHLIKSEKTVYAEYERFASAVWSIDSRTVLAHIRQASNPKGVSNENSQPFKYKDYIFAHNRTINISDEVVEALGEWKQKIRGLNDSETYFWRIAKRHTDKNRSYKGLNVVFSDSERLYAYCKYDKEEDDGSSRHVGAGMELTHLKLHPSEEIRTNLARYMMRKTKPLSRTRWTSLHNSSSMEQSIFG